MESREPTTPTTELVLTGQSLILKFKCCHLLEFQNEALSSLDQLNGGCGTPLTFPLASHSPARF